MPRTEVVLCKLVHIKDPSHVGNYGHFPVAEEIISCDWINYLAFVAI